MYKTGIQSSPNQRQPSSSPKPDKTQLRKLRCSTYLALGLQALDEARQRGFHHHGLLRGHHGRHVERKLNERDLREPLLDLASVERRDGSKMKARRPFLDLAVDVEKRTRNKGLYQRERPSDVHYLD